MGVGHRFLVVAMEKMEKDKALVGMAALFFVLAPVSLTFIFLDVLKKTLYGNFALHYHYSCYSCILYDNITFSWKLVTIVDDLCGSVTIQTEFS